MPAPASDSDTRFSLLLKSSATTDDPPLPVTYPLRHSLSSPIHRIAINWSRGNTLRVSLFSNPNPNNSSESDDSGGNVVEFKLGGAGNGGVKDDDAQWRRIVYGSVKPYAVFQNKKNSALAMSKLPVGALSNVDW